LAFLLCNIAAAEGIAQFAIAAAQVVLQGVKLIVEASKILLKVAEAALSLAEEVGQGVLEVAKVGLDFCKAVVSVALDLAKVMVEGALELLHIELFEFDIELSTDATSIEARLVAVIVGIRIDVNLALDFSSWGSFWESVGAFAGEIFNNIKASLATIIERMRRHGRDRRQIENLTAAVGSWATVEIPQGNCIVSIENILGEVKQMMTMLASQVKYAVQLADDLEANAKAAVSETLVDQMKAEMMGKAARMDKAREANIHAYNER